MMVVVVRLLILSFAIRGVDRTFYWNRQEPTSQWEMPPSIRPFWVMSRDGLFVHIDAKNVLTSIAGMH